MKRRWMGVMALAMLCTMAAWGHAVQVGGTVEVGADVLPALGMAADLEVMLSGEAWSVSSDTNVPLVPTSEISESLLLSYDVDAVRFEASVALSLAPFSFGPMDVSATVGLLDLTVREEDPAAALSSDLTVGATFDETADPYVSLYTLLGLGDHWLANTTTFDFEPLDVGTSLLAYLSLGTVNLGDGGVTVTAYGYVSMGVVPFGFSYAQLNARVSFDGISILNTVTYSGETSFEATSTVTLDLDAVTVTVWGSYSSTASDPFGVGASVSVPWGSI
ncbi:hypothetical protein ACFLTM_04720 [Candidatus Bipolaricaulota bacterium]